MVDTRVRSGGGLIEGARTMIILCGISTKKIFKLRLIILSILTIFLLQSRLRFDFGDAKNHPPYRQSYIFHRQNVHTFIFFSRILSVYSTELLHLLLNSRHKYFGENPILHGLATSESRVLEGYSSTAY